MIRGDYDRHKPEAGINISWGAVFAGAVSFVAVFIVLSLITSALGFGFLNPSGPEPLAGVGTATAIAVIITLLVSFFVGGAVAGFASRRTGKLHGFLAWALSIVLLVTVVMGAISSIFSAATSALGSIASGAGQVVSTAGSAAGSTVSAGIDQAYKQIADELQAADTDQAVQDAESILRDTGVEELQPEYLQSALSQSRDEIVQAGQDILVEPERSEEIIDTLVVSLNQRAEHRPGCGP